MKHKLSLLVCLAVAFVEAHSDTAGFKKHMLERRPVSTNLNALLQAASFVAEQADPQHRKDIFSSQGNIFDVQDEVSFYSSAARLPGVVRIGEIGFNAGHSVCVERVRL